MPVEKQHSKKKKGPVSAIAIASFVVMLALIIFVETVFPRNVESAKARIEKQGYKQVQVKETRRYCGKNRQVFTFTATNADGLETSGQLCFDLIRFLSSVTED